MTKSWSGLLFLQLKPRNSPSNDRVDADLGVEDLRADYDGDDTCQRTSYKGAEQENRAPLQEGATESGYIFYC